MIPVKLENKYVFSCRERGNTNKISMVRWRPREKVSLRCWCHPGKVGEGLQMITMEMNKGRRDKKMHSARTAKYCSGWKSEIKENSRKSHLVRQHL